MSWPIQNPKPQKTSGEMVSGILAVEKPQQHEQSPEKIENRRWQVGQATEAATQKKFITRAEARRRAARHVVKRMFHGATVRDGAEASHSLYNVRREDTWVVHKNGERPATRLGSSEVVVVCKRTGRVLHEGSAQDEG